MSSLKSFLALLAGASFALSGTIIGRGGSSSSRGYGNVGGGGGGYGNVGGGGWGDIFGRPGAVAGGGSGGGYGNNYEQPVVSGGGGGGGGGYGNNYYERPVASAEYGGGGGGGGQAACGTPGDCYANGCEADFLNEWNVTGVCAGGRYTGCACAKCGDVNGPCDASGCAGVGGMCQAGPYQGCECGGGPPGVQHH